MASQVWKDCKFWLQYIELSVRSSQVNLQNAAEIKDATVFGSQSRVKQPGLKAATFSAQGLYEATASDKVDDSNLDFVFGTTGAFSLSPTDGADGSLAYAAEVLPASRKPFGAPIGDLAAFEISGEGTNGTPLVRGTILHPSGVEKSASGNGTARQLGAVSSAQRVYAALHVPQHPASSTLAVKVQSDDASGMTTPVDRITFATVNGTTNVSQWMSAAGAITDTWWRVTWTLTGSPYKFCVVVGIV